MSIDSSPSSAHSPTRTNDEHRGAVFQLIIGIICMVMIANLQYGWSLFVIPINHKFHWSRAAIQVAFSLFVLAETWLVPIEGWFVDQFGPRIVVMAGGLLVALAWGIDSVAASLPVLYGAAILSGIGAGAVYGTCLANALKWFVGRRGVATGFTAAGFGAGAAATVIPIREIIAYHGYQSAFLWMGLLQGSVILIASQFLKAPAHALAPPVVRAGRNLHSIHNFKPMEVLRTPLFWVLYGMFVLVATGGLIVTAQLASIASDFGVADSPLSLLGITGTVLTFALLVDNLMNGLARPFFGWISDHIGRELTMFIAFMANALATGALSIYGRSPVMFLVTSALIYFTWGEIYSLFPSTCTDSYGRQFAATNAGMLYTAKGTAALLVPVASLLAGSTGGWQAVFSIGAAMNVVAAIMALVVLKPMRAAQHTRPKPSSALYTET